jgi:hypothetical protein
MALLRTLACAAFAAGAALGIVVTRGLHRNPAKRFWNTRLGNTPWRRANLPVGGTIAAVVAGVLAACGLPSAAFVVGALGLGMAAGAIGVGLMDPLGR